MIRLYITYRAVLIRHCKYTSFILFTKEKQSFFQKKYSTLCYTLYIYSSLLAACIHQHIRNTDKNQYDKPDRRKELGEIRKDQYTDGM